jgi:hypothetical protein
MVRQIQRGQLKATKMGQLWMIEEADLDAWVAGRHGRGPRAKLADLRVQAKLEKLLRSGKSVVEAMKAIGVDQSEYYRDRYGPEFRERMDAARTAGAELRKAS